MNLDDILRQLRETLGEIHLRNTREWEIRMDLRLLEEIEWHLSEYRRAAGNRARPEPNSKSEDFSRGRERKYWDEYGGFSRKEHEEARERMYDFWKESFGPRKSKYSSDFFGWDEKEGLKNKAPPPNPERPWPEVLGVRGTATKPEIEKAYRRLAMRFHPDRKPEGNTKKFQEINAAYQRARGGK